RVAEQPGRRAALFGGGPDQGDGAVHGLAALEADPDPVDEPAEFRRAQKGADGVSGVDPGDNPRTPRPGGFAPRRAPAVCSGQPPAGPRSPQPPGHRVTPLPAVAASPAVCSGQPPAGPRIRHRRLPSPLASRGGPDRAISGPPVFVTCPSRPSATPGWHPSTGRGGEAGHGAGGGRIDLQGVSGQQEAPPPAAGRRPRPPGPAGAVPRGERGPPGPSPRRGGPGPGT